MPRRANLCQHRHTVALSPIRQLVCGSSPNFWNHFLQIATTNKSGAINPSIFCLFGFIFPKELLLWFVHHMYTGLSNGGRINEVARGFDQFPYIVRRTPHPELGPTCEFRLCHTFTTSRRRPASTLALAPGHISFITHFA